MAEGYDVVYGYPEQESHGLLLDLASRMTEIQSAARHGHESRIARQPVFGCFAPIFARDSATIAARLSPIDVLLGWGAMKFGATPVENPPRTFGRVELHRVQVDRPRDEHDDRFHHHAAAACQYIGLRVFPLRIRRAGLRTRGHGILSTVKPWLAFPSSHP